MGSASGAPQSLQVATREELDDGPTGSYFVGRSERKPPPPALDQVVLDRAWAIWEEQTGFRYPL